VKNLTIGKIVWCLFVLVVLYLHLVIGLEERLEPRTEKHSATPLGCGIRRFWSE